MIRCVYEVDDDLWMVDKSSGAWSDEWIEVAQTMEANVTAAHAVTTTNDHLAAILRELNPVVHVIPNTITRRLLSQRRGRS